MGTEDLNGTGGGSLVSVKNGLFALLGIAVLVGGYFASQSFSLSTFLGGVTREKIFAIGDRHIAILVNGATLKPGESAGSSFYLENLAETQQTENLCNVFITMYYDSGAVSLQNLERSQSVPAEFETFDIRNDAKKGVVSITAASKQCNAEFKNEVMELVTFNIQAHGNAPLGFYEFKVSDDSHVVDVRKKNVTELDADIQNGAYVYDTPQQDLVSVTPSVVPKNQSVGIDVHGTNVYVLDSVQNIDENASGQQTFYLEKSEPGYNLAHAKLPNNIPPGSYAVCSRALFGSLDQCVCSSTALLTVE